MRCRRWVASARGPPPRRAARGSRRSVGGRPRTEPSGAAGVTTRRRPGRSSRRARTAASRSTGTRATRRRSTTRSRRSSATSRHATSGGRSSPRRWALRSEGGVQAREPRKGVKIFRDAVRRRAREREDRGRRRVRRRLGDGGRPRAAPPAHPRAGTGGGARRAWPRPVRARVVRARPSCRARRRRRSSRTRSTRCAASAPSARRSSRSSTHTRPGSTATTGRRASRRRRSRRTTSSRRLPSSRRGSARTAGRRSQNSMFLDALAERLGEADARRVFADLRESNDPESAGRAFPGRFPQQVARVARARQRRPRRRQLHGRAARRSCVRLERAARRWRSAPRPGTRCSSPARRSATSSRSSSRRWSSPAPASTCAAPCSRACRSCSSAAGPDFAWSATSSQADNLDLFVETLCEDDQHYLYRGQCEPMRRFVVGTLKAQGQPDQQISYDETTHGPVIGYAKVGGKRVAISLQRSTRGRELLSTKAFYDLNTGRVDSAKDFLSTMNGVEFSFNWFYADDRDIAMFSSGRLPLRAAGTDPALPTVGNGDFDWRGFVPFAGHAQGDQPAVGDDPQLEQPAGVERRRGRLELLVRLGASRRSPARGRRGAQEAHARDAHGRDEQGCDAGSPRRPRLADRQGRAADRARRRARARRRLRACSTTGV